MCQIEFDFVDCFYSLVTSIITEQKPLDHTHHYHNESKGHRRRSHLQQREERESMTFITLTHSAQN